MEEEQNKEDGLEKEEDEKTQAEARKEKIKRVLEIGEDLGVLVEWICAAGES